MNKTTKQTLILIVCLLVAFTFVQNPKECKTMTIKFDGTVGQLVDFGPILDGLSEKTISYWVYVDSYAGSAAVLGKYHYSGSPTYKGWYSTVSNHKVLFGQYWSTTAGLSVIWSSPANSITTGAWHHVVITYDWTSASNDPLIYIDGVSQTVTEGANPPSGSPLEDATDSLTVGGLYSGSTPVIGKLAGVIVYNRILSATEIVDAYTQGLTANPLGNYVPSQDGLVFRLNTACAKGLTYSTFPGSTLGSSNKVMDMINCYEGTPANSPAGL